MLSDEAILRIAESHARLASASAKRVADLSEPLGIYFNYATTLTIEMGGFFVARHDGRVTCLSAADLFRALEALVNQGLARPGAESVDMVVAMVTEALRAQASP